MHPIPEISLLLLDLDGTVRTCTHPRRPFPKRPGEQLLVPGIGAVLARYQAAGVPVGVATNQGGIGLDLMTERDFQAQLVELKDMLQAEGVDAEALSVEFCPHAPDALCPCRKPEPGMLLTLMHRFQVPPARTLFVGDRSPDQRAAARANCRFLWAWDFHPWDGYPEHPERKRRKRG